MRVEKCDTKHDEDDDMAAYIPEIDFTDPEKRPAATGDDGCRMLRNPDSKVLIVDSDGAGLAEVDRNGNIEKVENNDLPDWLIYRLAIQFLRDAVDGVDMTTLPDEEWDRLLPQLVK